MYIVVSIKLDLYEPYIEDYNIIGYFQEKDRAKKFAESNKSIDKLAQEVTKCIVLELDEEVMSTVKLIKCDARLVDD